MLQLPGLYMHLNHANTPSCVHSYSLYTVTLVLALILTCTHTHIPHTYHTHTTHIPHTHTHTHSDVMNLSLVKQQIYVALENRGGRVGKGMDVIEARLNVMQAVFVAIQTSPTLDEDILLKGYQIFQTLLNRHFTETLEVPMLLS